MQQNATKGARKNGHKHPCRFGAKLHSSNPPRHTYCGGERRNVVWALESRNPFTLPPQIRLRLGAIDGFGLRVISMIAKGIKR